MDSPRAIFFVLCYVVVITTIITVMAVGMGAEGMNPNQSVINFSPPAEDSYLSGIPVLGETADTASMVSSVLFTVFGVLFWTLPEAIFPLWANIIFIKLPLIYLLISLLEVLLP